MEPYKIIFNNKIYELVGYSIIDFPEEHKYYKETSEQIISNAEFYSHKYGVYYLDMYKDVASFVEKYANTVSLVNSEYIFKFGVFIKGTFVFKEVK